MGIVKESPFVFCQDDNDDNCLEPAVEVGLFSSIGNTEQQSRSVYDMLRQFSPNQEEEKLKHWSEDLERLDGIVTVRDIQNLSSDEFKERRQHWDDALVSILTHYRDLMFHDEINKNWWEEDHDEIPELEMSANFTQELYLKQGNFFMIESCSAPGYVLKAPSEQGLSPSLVPQSQATANTIWTYNNFKKQIKCAVTKRVLDIVTCRETNRVQPGAAVILWNENMQENQKWDFEDGRLVCSQSNRLSQQNKNEDGSGILVLDIYLEINSPTENPTYLVRMWPEDGSIAQQWNIRPAAPPSHPTNPTPPTIASTIINLPSPDVASFLDQTNNISPLSSLTPQHMTPNSGSSRFLLPPSEHSGNNLSPKDNNSNRRRIGFYLESVVNPGWVLESSHLCQGAVVHLVPKKSYTNDTQRWTYDSKSGNVANLHDSTLVLDITRGSSQPGVSICMWPRNGRANQSWRFVRSKNNTTDDDTSIITIQTKHSSRHVLQAEVVKGNHDVFLSPVFMWPSSEDQSQKWKLVYS